MTDCPKCGTEMVPREQVTMTVKASSLTSGSSRPADPHCVRCEDECEHLNRLFYSDLALCGCGNPEASYDLVRGLLVLAPFYERYKEVRDFFGDAPASEGAYHMVLSLMTHAGLIEHGGTAGGSWATEKGKRYLELMQRHSFDDMDKTGSPHYREEDLENCPLCNLKDY